MHEIPGSKIIEFIADRVQEAGAEGVVLGLSGGIDSAVTAYLAKRALGPDRILALLLFEGGVSPSEDVEDAREVARNLGLRTREIDISPILHCYWKELGVDGSDRVAQGNLKARVRMTILYWHANLSNLLVLGTGNKTEILMGYSTKYGDSAADLLPLAGLYKTEVRDLAKDLGVPSRIQEKKPSAGLWPGQTDEEEMGITYPQADAILRGWDQGLSRDELAEAYGTANADLVLKRMIAAQHKRMPPCQPD